MKSNNHIYFSGLNGLRFFAALAVVVTHIELIKSQYGCENLWEHNKLVFELGPLGVIFFFVLSGFLITYLLLKEKSVTGTIAVKKFYFRRILRIWPLYYLITLAGFLVLPHIPLIHHSYLSKILEQNFSTNFALYLLFVPNLAFSMFAAVPHIGQTWSIGVEEQFYLLWPLIVKYSKKVIKALIVVIVFLLIAKTVVLLLYSRHPQSYILKVLKIFLAMTKMESMAIGGIGAYYLFNQPQLVSKLYNNVLLIGALLLIPVGVYVMPSKIQDAAYLFYSVLFLVIILNVSGNPKSILKLESKLYKALGDISYGIYMYHLIVVAFVITGLKHFGFEVNNGLGSQLVVYTLSMTGSISIAWLSYNYFEKWFLNMKHKFTVIKSGSKS